MRNLVKKLVLPAAVLTASVYSYTQFDYQSLERSPASLNKEDGTVIKRQVKQIKRTTQIVITKKTNDKDEEVSEEKKPEEKPVVTQEQQKPEGKPIVTQEQQKPEEKPLVAQEQQKPEEKPVVTQEQQKPEEKPVVTQEQQKPEEKPVATEEEDGKPIEDKALVCVDEEDYNNMVDEIADLKDRMKTIASAIPEDLFTEEQSGLVAQLQALQSMTSAMPGLNWNSMYQPWSMNNYLMNNMMTNWMMSNTMNPFVQSQASQVLGSSYQPFFNPITINNFNYGETSGTMGVPNSRVPSNYYSGEMNFSGLDQVTFQNHNQTNSSQAPTPAYFAF